MLVIFAFFSVFSALLIGAISVAVVNVVIRRECAYLVEERLNAMTENQRFYAQTIDADQSRDGSQLLLRSLMGARDFVWPGSYTSMVAALRKRSSLVRPMWIKQDSYTGVIVDHGQLDIRSITGNKQDAHGKISILNTTLNPATTGTLTQAAGLEMLDSDPVALGPYREQEGIHGEIAANFIPGSRRAVPVVVTARNWRTGQFEDWVICTVRPSYARTFTDLSRMGLHRASWLMPLGALGFTLASVYLCGLILSVRLSRRIVTLIDDLSHAAQQVGKGNFSVNIPHTGRDQVGLLATAFNAMTRDLRDLRAQEKQAIQLEWDVGLAREIQEHLLPEFAPSIAGISIAGVNHPARIVSGDLHAIFPFNEFEVGILCADLSGKGVSAALMMAHMQGLVHGRLVLPGERESRPAPAKFIEALNCDLQGRFGDNRYATLFYGEFDAQSGVMRYINAGHCPPILILPTGDATFLSEGDVPVGLFPNAQYQELTVTLFPGCKMIVCSDGVTDALNAAGEAFGEARLIDLCRRIPVEANANTIVASIVDRVSDWAKGVERADDVTVVALAADLCRSPEKPAFSTDVAISKFCMSR